jgi:hypothetical protein
MEKTWWSHRDNRSQFNTDHALCKLDNQIFRHTLTISQYAIYIAFPRHKCVRERASRSRFTYTICLVPSELGFVLSHGGARDYQIPEGKVEIVCGTKFITQISPTTHLRHVSVM